MLKNNTYLADGSVADGLAAVIFLRRSAARERQPDIMADEGGEQSGSAELHDARESMPARTCPRRAKGREESGSLENPGS